MNSAVNTVHCIRTAVVLAGMVLVSSPAVAGEACSYLTLVPNVIEGQQAYAAGQQERPEPTHNNSVCIDIPVPLIGEKVVFNISSLATRDGTPAGAPVALRYMWMLGTLNLARADSSTTDNVTPGDFHLRGVFYGKAYTWALSDEWWANNVPGATENPHKLWLDKLIALQNRGIDIQLEICGVTMYNKGLTREDLYPGILVNQGAIARLVYLQNREGYAYIEPSYISNDFVDRQKVNKGNAD